MVHIINGEIVPDDDPRVRARFQQPAGPASSRRGPGGFGSLNGGSGAGSAPASAGGPQGPPPAAASPLAGLARQLGLEGSVQVPAVAAVGLPARSVAKIHLALAALLIVLFGWRALVFLAFAYFVSSQQPAAAAGPPPAGQHHGGGAPRPQRGGLGGL